MTSKRNPNISKREALIAAWKLRGDYKGYDRSRGSSFNSWRAIINTDKGRRVGFPESWNDYQVFMRDVKGEWTVGKIVCRADASTQHGSGNSFWADKGEENVGRMVRLEYDGSSKTLVEWCAELGLNYQGVRQRFFKGKDLTPKEILFGKERKRRTPQDRDFTFRTARMFGAYRLRDKRRGYVTDITLDFLRGEIANGCIYCGDSENVGLDRIDNSKGHLVDNVVPCCYSCNTARNDNFSFDEMVVIGKVIAEIKRMRRENK